MKMIFLYILKKYQNTIYCNGIFFHLIFIYIYVFVFFFKDYFGLIICFMGLANSPELTRVIFLFLLINFIFNFII
jgi:hypothetical protein